MNTAYLIGCDDAIDAAADTLTLPSGIKKGDIMVFGAAHYYDYTVTPSTGWQIALDLNIGSPTIGLIWRIADGTETGTVSIGTIGSYAHGVLGVWRPLKPVKKPTLIYTSGSSDPDIPAMFIPDGSVAIGFFMHCNGSNPFSSGIEHIPITGSSRSQDVLLGFWPTIGDRTNGPVSTEKGGGGTTESAAGALIFPPAASGPDSTMR
jgi:hypothetical protein